MNISEWMRRFAFINEWSWDYPTDAALAVYPHFYIDLLAAWNEKCYVGAREVLNELRRRIVNSNGWIVKRWWDYDYSDYPSDTIVVRVDDSGEIHCGYQRRWVEGLFKVDSEIVTEIVWHCHDGFGEEAGTVEIIASYLPCMDQR